MLLLLLQLETMRPRTPTRAAKSGVLPALQDLFLSAAARA